MVGAGGGAGAGPRRSASVAAESLVALGPGSDRDWTTRAPGGP